MDFVRTFQHSVNIVDCEIEGLVTAFKFVVDLDEPVNKEGAHPVIHRAMLMSSYFLIFRPSTHLES